MTAHVEDEIPYHRLVGDAVQSLRDYGAIDMETAVRADAMGYSMRALMTDAEQSLADNSN